MTRIAIIGAGAGGMFCAANIARGGAKVSVFEASASPMKKLLLSGGGRCNFTNLKIDSENPDEFYPRGARFLRKALRRFGAKDAIAFFESCGVKTKVEDEGRVFPKSDSAQEIADALMKAAKRNGANIMTGARVQKISKTDCGYEIICTQNGAEKIFPADAVVFAVGGMWAEALKKSLEERGVKFVPPVPSLFALETKEAKQNAWREMSGISVSDVRLGASVAGKKTAARGALLVTHFGLSGPAALKLSSFGAREFFDARYKFPLSVNWIPAFDAQKQAAEIQNARIESAKKKIKNTPLFGLPQKLWDFCILNAEADGEKIWANLPKKDENALLRVLCESNFECTGKSARKGEFVTAGGVSCSNIDSSSMSLKSDPGLCFIGECLDIDAVTGGFNLQAAWTCAKICADHVSKLNYDNRGL